MIKEIQKTIRFEVGGDPNGGYTNDPVDPGGETKWGIAKRYHQSVDIPALTLDGAEAIYKTEYWDKLFLDSYAFPPFRWKLFDIAVNQGVATATTFLHLLSVKDNMDAVWELATLQMKRYANKVYESPAKLKYLRGWTTRAMDIGKDLTI